MMDETPTPPNAAPPAPAPPPTPPPTLADGQARGLEPAWLTLQRISHWIATAVLGTFVVIASLLLIWLAAPTTLARVAIASGAFGLLMLLMWWAQFWPAIDYRHRSWSLDQRGLQIRRGVIWRTVIDIPRTRVQHTDVNQGPIERRFDLAHLVVHTAGTIGAMVTLDGLTRETASRVRDHLVQSESGDAV